MNQTTSDTSESRRASKISAICKELDERSFRKDDNDCKFMFITTHVLEKIWTDDCLKDFFEGFEWADEDFIETVKKKFLKVLSILVRIGWKGFEDFKAAFYDNPDRQDSKLPFHDISEIKQLDSLVANDFCTRQYKFIPITIEEKEDQEVSQSHLFPFVKESEVIAEEKGSVCVVFKEIVAPRQLITGSNKDPNAEETPIVRKSCALSKAPHTLRGEMDALAKLRNILFNNERVVPNLCTVIHGYTLDILFPYADLDLEDLIASRPKSHLVSSTSPKELIKELAGLANALGYLHCDLRSSEGESFVCVHNDIKPENILIFCGPDSPVGTWKIGDFGLATFKKVRDDQVAEDSYLRIPNSSVRHTLPSLTSPKRGPGSFQAPEVERQGQKVIGPESDVFSLGCIFIRVVTFAVGGADLLREFDEKRGREHGNPGSSTSYGHDYFHRNGGREINPEILGWLDQLESGKGGQNTWIQACTEIIKPMLEIDTQQRPKAHEVEDDLLHIVENWSDHTLSEKHSNGSNTPLTPSSDSDELSSDPQSYQISFSRVKLFHDGVFQTAISSSHEHLAFLSPHSVRIVRLAALDPWTKGADTENIMSNESKLLDIKAPDTAFWRAMALSKDHLALHTADAVYVYKLQKRSHMKLKGFCIFERSKFEYQLFAVAVSVNGDVILQFKNFIQLFVQREAWKCHTLEILGTLQSAVFDTNADWIFAISIHRCSSYSYFWQIKDLSQTHRKSITGPNNGASCILNKQILAFNGSPRFALWDEFQGQVRIIYHHNSLQAQSFSKNGLGNIITGAIIPIANAIIFIQNSNDHDSSGIGNQVCMIPLSNKNDQELELGAPLDICKIRIPITNSCGIAVTIDNQSELVKFVFVAHLDGLVEKIEFLHN